MIDQNRWRVIKNDIEREIDRQNKKWGDDRDQRDFIWSLIMLEELGEAAEAILKNSPILRQEIIQAVSVGIAWIDNIDRREK